MSSPPGPAITVIGDGLAGSVLALALAHHGAAVRLVGGGPATATALSYGALPRGRPSQAWRRLERRHGPLGWRPSGLVLHDPRGGLAGQLAALTRTLPLPLARVDAPTWSAARRGALVAAGVELLAGEVTGLARTAGGSWELAWSAPSAGAGDSATEATLVAETVVLAAGAACRTLWPALPARLRHSWAGVLVVEGGGGARGASAAGGAASPWLEQARRGRVVQPRHWRRPALEARAPALQQPAWIVDAGLAPWGDGVVVGQISLIPAAVPLPAPEGPLEPPDPGWMDERLRQGLARLDPALAALEAPYRQVPVSFCDDGQPLVGPVAEAPGLWLFTGFSAAFSRVPDQAELLATRLLAAR